MRYIGTKSPFLTSFSAPSPPLICDSRREPAPRPGRTSLLLLQLESRQLEGWTVNKTGESQTPTQGSGCLVNFSPVIDPATRQYHGNLRHPALLPIPETILKLKQDFKRGKLINKAILIISTLILSSFFLLKYSLVLPSNFVSSSLSSYYNKS